MGAGGSVESVSEHYLMCISPKQYKKQQLQTVELKVAMDCDGCELKVKNALSSLRGLLLTIHYSPLPSLFIPSSSFKKAFSPHFFFLSFF